MEATALYLLMPKKYTNQSKRIWNKVIFIVLRNSAGFTANNMEKIGLKDMCMIFPLIMLLIPVISLIFLNIWWKKKI